MSSITTNQSGNSNSGIGAQETGDTIETSGNEDNVGLSDDDEDKEDKEHFESAGASASTSDKCVNVENIDFESIMHPRKSNMKAEIIGLPSEIGEFTNSYCMELCRYIDNPKTIDFLRLRDLLYDMLIYEIGRAHV